MILKKIFRYFDKLEDKIRSKLSHYPIIYAFIGGTGVILFWRGIWHIADGVNLNSGLSILLGLIILLLSGVFVSNFIGNQLIISGFIGEKKLEEKEEIEIEAEEAQIRNLQKTLSRVEEKLDHLDKEIENNNK